MNLQIGRTGLLIVLAIFLLLVAEDVLIWVNSGVIPGVEFFLASLLVVVVFFLAIREAGRHPPPRR